MTKDEIIRCAMDWYDSGAEVREEFEAMIGVLVDSAERLEREACAKVCESFRDEDRERRLEDASREAEGYGDELTILRNWSECRLWNAAHERSANAIRARSNKGE